MLEYEIEIQRHAEDSKPFEACGFLFYGEKNQVRAERTKNIAERPEEYFEIDINLSEAARGTGKLLGVYHSHVTAPAEFSQADVAISEAVKLPFYLYSLMDKRFNVYKPKGYQIPLIGRQFAMGILDCSTIVMDYYLQKLGIVMPFFPHDMTSLLLGHKTFRNYLKENNFIELDDIRNLRLHDIVIMSLNGLGTENHSGVICGENEMLHQLVNRPSCVTPYTNTYWQRQTVLAFRHGGV